jgi:hypothetical protein
MIKGMASMNRNDTGFMQRLRWMLRASSCPVMALCLAGWPLPSGAADSYAVGPGATVSINEQGACANVTNYNGSSIFVATRSAAEWSSFRSHLPPGVGAAACCVRNTNGVGWYTVQDGSCCQFQYDNCGGYVGYSCGCPVT